jgi:hypothetical protein
MKGGIVALSCLMAIPAQAQSGEAGFFNPLSASKSGIHLYGVSIYGGYYSGGSPFGLPTQAVTGGLPIPGSLAVAGGSANFGWSRSTDQANFDVTYSPSYIAYPDRTDLNTVGHAFSLNLNRKVGQKWSFGAGATGLIANLQQTYFSSNAFGLAASLPTTFEDLAAAFLSGKFTDAQLAASLTGASARLLPEQTYLYGRRIGSASLHAAVNYAASGRSTYHVNVSGTRVQGLSSNSMANSGSSVIPQTTAGSVSFGWGYSLTPRTNIGIEVGTTRTFSRLQDGYASNASFTMGHTMSQHWFVQAQLGGGLITYNRQSFVAPRKPQYLAGGSIGYKLRAHSLLASYNRTIGDAYGLGAGSTSNATAGWSMKAPGSRWSLSATYGYQRTDGSTLYNTESWRAMGGIARALSNHLFMSFQYSYFTFPSSQNADAARLLGAESGLSMGLTWSPSQYR